MFIMFTADDITPCPHCEGHGVIKLDLYQDKDILAEYFVECGVCQGVGMLVPDGSIAFEVEED